MNADVAAMKKLAEAVRLLICIRDIPSSNLGQDATTLTEVSRGTIKWATTASILIHHSSFIWPFDIINPRY
jgi:hypothetical protein